MNLPNTLSLSRILAMPFFVGVLLAPMLFEGPARPAAQAWFHGIAFVMAVAVTITDWLDGDIARRTGQITTLGKLLDPLADKVFVAAALIALSELDIVPAWATIIVIAREFLVTGLRQAAIEKGIVISADRLGKHKTAWQLALILTAIFVSAVRAALQTTGHWETVTTQYHGTTITLAMIWIPLIMTLLLTIASGWNYARANRAVFG